MSTLGKYEAQESSLVYTRHISSPSENLLKCVWTVKNCDENWKMESAGNKEISLNITPLTQTKLKI